MAKRIERIPDNKQGDARNFYIIETITKETRDPINLGNLKTKRANLIKRRDNEIQTFNDQIAELDQMITDMEAL